MKYDAYTYHFADGSSSRLPLGENGMDQQWLALLQDMDRQEENCDRRWRRHNDSLREDLQAAGVWDDYGTDLDFGHAPNPCERMRLAVQQLPPAQQQLVGQVYYGRQKQKDLAAREGITPSALNQRLKKALARLEAELE